MVVCVCLRWKVLSGCIPVLLDGDAPDAYLGSAKERGEGRFVDTPWAFRRKPTAPPPREASLAPSNQTEAGRLTRFRQVALSSYELDYDQFCVRVNASLLLADPKKPGGHDASPGLDLARHLAGLGAATIASLRRGLDRAAPRLRYKVPFPRPRLEPTQAVADAAPSQAEAEKGGGSAGDAFAALVGFLEAVQRVDSLEPGNVLADGA